MRLCCGGGGAGLVSGLSNEGAGVLPVVRVVMLFLLLLSFIVVGCLPCSCGVLMYCIPASSGGKLSLSLCSSLNTTLLSHSSGVLVERSDIRYLVMDVDEHMNLLQN